MSSACSIPSWLPAPRADCPFTVAELSNLCALETAARLSPAMLALYATADAGSLPGARSFVEVASRTQLALAARALAARAAGVDVSTRAFAPSPAELAADASVDAGRAGGLAAAAGAASIASAGWLHGPELRAASLHVNRNRARPGALVDGACAPDARLARRVVRGAPGAPLAGVTFLGAVRAAAAAPRAPGSPSTSLPPSRARPVLVLGGSYS